VIGRALHGERDDENILLDLDENLDRLTVGSFVPHMDDMPLRMQRSVVEVGNGFGNLL